MKTTRFLFINLFLTFALLVPNAPAQDYTKWHLPEGATARLGKGSINEITYSADGSRLAVASSIGIWIYDAQTGKELDLLGHTDGVRSLCFSPDGTTITSCSSHNTIRLWSTVTGQHLNTLTVDYDGVRRVRFSPDGTTLASGSNRGLIYLSDVATGKLLQTLIGHRLNRYSMCFSPDGTTLASGGYGDNTVKLWNVITGATLQTLKGHGITSSVCFSPDGTTLASSGSDEKVRLWKVRLWDVATGHLQKTLTSHTQSVVSMCFSPDGATLASGSVDGIVRLWDVATGHLQKTLTSHTQSVVSMCFSPDGATLASGSVDGIVRLWNVTTGHLQKTIIRHTNRIMSMCFSPDGATLASGSDIVRLWNATTGHLQKTYLLQKIRTESLSVLSVCFSPDGSTLAAGVVNVADLILRGIESDDSTLLGKGQTHIMRNLFENVWLWDIATGHLQKTFTGKALPVPSVCFSPNGNVLASGNHNNDVCLWGTATGHLQKTLIGHKQWVFSLCFSPDGLTLASGSDDRTVRLWDVATGKQKKTLTGHTSSVNSVCFSTDGSVLASGSDDRTVRLWDATTGQHLETLTGHMDNVNSVYFSPNGQILVSGSDDKTVRLWDAATGQHLKTLIGHASWVKSVCFSPEGTTLASGSGDGTVLLWDTSMFSAQPSSELPPSGEKIVSTPLTPQQIAKKALAATVLIVVEDENGLPLGSGSAFFISRDMIATNLHVVKTGHRATFKRVGKDKWYNVKEIIEKNTLQDLVILKVPDLGATVLSLGNSDAIEVGEPVYAIGNPKGLEGTFSPGFISSIRGKDSRRRIQITAPISRGSSGGPVLNNKGEVIGVVVGAITEGQNLNFAIPSNYLRKLLDKAKEQNRTLR